MIALAKTIIQKRLECKPIEMIEFEFFVFKRRINKRTFIVLH